MLPLPDWDGPGRPWSLGDMLIRLGFYIFLLDDIRGTGAAIEGNSDIDAALDTESKKHVEELYGGIRHFGRQGGFEMMAVDAENGLAELDDEHCTYRTVATRLKHVEQGFTHEANQRSFWLIHASKLKFFDASFGKDVEAAFPDASWEIREAGSCYAVGRNTACVFHLMRGVEHGMRALAVAVGVTSTKIPLEYQEWNALIGQIESRAKAVDAWGTGAELTNARRFFKRIIADLYSFKDDVRNVTMHTRQKPYDSPGALRVRNRAKEWFQILATKASQDMPIGALLDRSLFLP